MDKQHDGCVWGADHLERQGSMSQLQRQASELQEANSSMSFEHRTLADRHASLTDENAELNAHLAELQAQLAMHRHVPLSTKWMMSDVQAAEGLRSRCVCPMWRLVVVGLQGLLAVSPELSALSAESATCAYSGNIIMLCRSEEADERNKLTSRLSDVESSAHNQRLEYQSVHAR